MENLLLNLNLQFFADNGEGTDNDTETTKDTNNSTNTNTDTNEKVESDIGFSEEQIKKLIQSEGDRIRTEYTKKLKAKEKELDEIKNSSMTEQERLEYERQKLEDVLAEREQTLREKEVAFAQTQLELQTVDMLKEQNLPLEAKAFLVGGDIDVTKQNINAFKTMFDNAVAQEIGERIKGANKEHIESVGASGSVTKAEFQKMNYTQRTELFKSNPELYKELSR